MLGWSIDVKYEGRTQYHSLSTDLSLDRKIRAAAEATVDCPEYRYWFDGCGYPNRYLIRNDHLWLPITDYYNSGYQVPCPRRSEQRKLANFPDAQIFLVEIWDQS